MSKRTTVHLLEDLLDRARRKAAAEGRTLTSLTADGLQQVVEENRGVERGKRILPPISKARGGLMPEIALDEGSRLQGLEDLDTARA